MLTADLFNMENTEPPAPPTPLDEVCAALERLRRDDVVTVGGVALRVTHARGVSILAVRVGTKGRKLYQVTPHDRTGVVAVVEVWPGSGDPKGEPPIAVGALT